MLRETAGKVSKALIKGVLHKATGLMVAADLCELASNLYGVNQRDDGFIHVVNTPAARARDYFKPYIGVSLALEIPGFLCAVLSPVVFSAFIHVPIWIERYIPPSVRATWPAMCLLIFGTVFYLRTYFPVRQWVEDLMAVMADPSPQAAKILSSTIFIGHALLPMISAFIGTRQIVMCGRNAFVDIDWISSVALGVFNLSALFHRQLSSEISSQSELVLACLRMRQIAWKALIVICIWFYGLTTIDNILWYVSGGRLYFGVVLLNRFLLQDPNLDWSGTRNIPFLLAVLSSWSQQRLLDLLRKREALLRLLGAERVLAASLVLVMRGVSVMTAEGPSKALEFLEKAAPPAGICFAVLVTRILAVPLGTSSIHCITSHFHIEFTVASTPSV